MTHVGPAERGSERLTDRNLRVVAAAFLIIVALYIVPLYVTDPSLRWAALDEECCHVPTIRAIRDEALLTAVTDYAHYRSATAPLYHLLMSLALDRIDPIVPRVAWIFITFGIGLLLYRDVATNLALHRAERAALALVITFLMSPTVRASARYFITDGLAVHLAIAALVLLRRASSGPRFSMPGGIVAIIVAYASFYTRQHYLWAPLFVAYWVFSNASTTRAKMTTIGACLVLTVPAVLLFAAWRGFTPPLDWPVTRRPNSYRRCQTPSDFWLYMVCRFCGLRCVTSHGACTRTRAEPPF